MKKCVKLIILALLLVAAMCTMTACGKSTADVGNYLGATFSGLDGQGTARADFAYADFEYEIMSQWKEKDRTFQKLGTLTMLESSFEFELDKTEGLKNGDKVTVTMTYDKDLAKELGCKLNNLSKTVVVEGLIEPIMLDPFDPAVFNTESGVTVTIEGTAPVAHISIRNNCSDDMDQRLVDYSIDKEYEIKNGDVITVTASLSDWSREQGYVLTQTETTITVSGLNSYITDLSMLNSEDAAAVQTAVANTFAAHADGRRMSLKYTYDGKLHSMDINSSNGVRYSEPRFTGKAYTAVADGWTATYLLIVPFQVDVTNVGSYWWGGNYTDEEIFKDFNSANCYMVFKDLMLDAEGNLIKGENGIDISDVFQNAEDMQSQLTEYYGNDGLTEGPFNK